MPAQLFDQTLASLLHQRKEQAGTIQTLDVTLAALLKQRKEMGGTVRPLVAHDPAQLQDLSSSDYLGLTTSEEVREQYLANLAAAPRIMGSTGSRLLSGSSSQHADLEARLANYFGSEDSLLFSTGFDGNRAFFVTVPHKHDIIIYDELMHASFIDGLRGSAVPKTRRFRMRHNDPEALAELLHNIPAEVLNPRDGPKPTVFFATESLYSMDADFAPLPAFLDILDDYVPREQQCNFVDEAHSVALYGQGGRGITWALGPEYRNRVHVRLITFSKGFGCAGSALLMSSIVKYFMTNSSRSVIFSTAPPHSVLISINTALDVISTPAGDRLRESLFDAIEYFNHRVDELLAVCPSHVYRRPEQTTLPFPAEAATLLPERPASAIAAIITPDPEEAYRFLLDRGIVVSSIVPPAVAPGMERIRICLRSNLDRYALDHLVDSLYAYAQTKDRTYAAPLLAKL